MPEEKQVEEPKGEPQKEPQGEPLTEAEQAEQVKQLLSDEPEGEPEKEPEGEPEELSGKPGEPEREPEVVTDELIEKFPTLKMYRGKPLKDVMGGYDGIVRQYNAILNEKKELEKKLKKDSLSELGEAPDRIEDPEGFNKWLKKRDDLIRQQALESQVKQPQTNYLTEVQKRLPEGTDVNKVIEGWSKFNSDILYDEFGNLRQEVSYLYSQNPNLLVSEILKYYNLVSKAEQNDTLIQKKVKQETYERTKQSIKDAQRTIKESKDVKATPRTEALTEEDELLSQIYAKANSGN